MATSGSGLISQKLQHLFNESKDLQCQNLKNQWTRDIEDSNRVIENIQTKENYISSHSEKIEEQINVLNDRLDYYNELGIGLDGELSSPYGFSEMRRNLESNYRTLSIQFYKYNFQQNKKQYEDSKKLLNKINKEQKNIERKMNRIDNKMREANNRIESLGATFLNIVLTISITSTMVTVLLNSSSEYSLAIILGCAWLLLTSIIFISSYFKANTKKENVKLPLVIYVVLTMVTILAFGFGWFESDKKKKENIEKVEVIENGAALSENSIFQKVK